jgi:hypothetical protein
VGSKCSIESPEIVENKRCADSENASCHPTSVLQQGHNLAASNNATACDNRLRARQSAYTETDHVRSPQRHRHLPLHRHRGQHCALGARPGCHAHRGCSPHRATESAIRVHACVHLKIIFGIVPVGLGGQIGSHAATRDSMQRPKSMPVCWPCRAFLSLGSFPVQRESWARPRDVLRRGSLPRRSSAGAWRSATRPHTA